MLRAEDSEISACRPGVATRAIEQLSTLIELVVSRAMRRGIHMRLKKGVKIASCNIFQS